MKNFMIIQPFIQMYIDASQEETLGHRLLNYVIATWASGLFLLASLGLGKVFYELVTNPSQFNHVTWGLIDYIP